MAGNIATTMDQLGTAVATIASLTGRTFDFPPDSAQPPFAYVDMPDRVDYDLTAGRGDDRVTINVVVGVAYVVDRTARDAIAAYAAGSGASSVKAAIEAAGAVGKSARVTSVTFRPVTLSGTMYEGAIFSVDIAL